jgi:hypothetical protein
MKVIKHFHHPILVVKCQGFFKNSSRGGGTSTKKGSYYTECVEIKDCYKKFGVVSYGLEEFFPRKFDVGSGGILPHKKNYFPPLGLHFAHFLKQIFGYTALHYTANRLNLQLSTCMVCLCKYHNSITNLFSLSIGSGIGAINLGIFKY